MRRFSLLAICLWVAPALAQPSARLATALDSARALAEAAADEVPGLAIAASIDGETVWSDGFGVATYDPETFEPATLATPQTRFRVGSVAKPMTAVAVAQLADSGRLDVDAPVQTYVPTFPEKRWTLTTRQLGAHLGGIRHYRGEEFMSNVRYPTVADGLAIFAADTLLHEPGTAYAYSSYGYNLISAVVEGASGRDFLGYMADSVFAPLGMTSTVPDWTDSLYSNRTDYFARWNGQIVPAPPVDNSYKWAGGGFLSSVDDMLRFGEAVVLGDALSETGRALLFTEQATRDGEGVQYGFGWRVATDDAGRRRIEHTGGSMGGTAYLLVLPEAGVVVAMATNIGGAELGWVPEVAALLAEAASAE